MLSWRLRRCGPPVAVLALVIAAGACGDGAGSGDAAPAGDSTATGSGDDGGEEVAPEQAEDDPPPSPDDVEAAARTGDTGTEDPGTGEVALSLARWEVRESPTGDIGVRYFALVENTSTSVLEISIEVEAVDADGRTLGRSGPQPFLDFIEPGEQLPVGLAGRAREAPADVLPDIVVREVADFKQERYGHIQFTAEVRHVDVREDEIVVETEITNTGDRPGQSLFYLAAFDASGAIVAAGPGGWIPSMLDVGESVVLEGEVGHAGASDLEVDRVEVFFPATPSMDTS